MLLFVNALLYREMMLNGSTVKAIFNLSSPIEGGVRLHSLTPPISLWQMRETKDFDIGYADYILNNDAAFVDLMRVICHIYNGEHVIVLVNTDEINTFITESLLKFIQQRYGYNGWVLNCLNDVLYAYESDFSVNGLYNLDQDRERYVRLENPMILLSGMVEENYEEK